MRAAAVSLLTIVACLFLIYSTAASYAQQWSGLYVTGFGEYASGTSSQHDNGFGSGPVPPANPCPPGEVELIPGDPGSCVLPGGDADGHYGISGALGGGGVGYNFLYQGFVLGLEADISGGRISGSSPFCGTTPHTCGTSIDALGEFKGRLGYAFGDFLPFVSGGLAVENVHAYDDLTGGHGTRALAGYTVGAGLEYRLTSRLSLRAEYLHTNVNGPALYQIVPGVPEHVYASTSAVRIGLNFYLNPAPAPVVARY